MDIVGKKKNNVHSAYKHTGAQADSKRNKENGMHTNTRNTIWNKIVYK